MRVSIVVRMFSSFCSLSSALNELQLVRHGFLQRSLAHGKLFAQLPQAGVLRLRHLPLCVCLKLRRGLQRSVDGAAHLRAQRAHLFLQLL